MPALAPMPTTVDAPPAADSTSADQSTFSLNAPQDAQNAQQTDNAINAQAQASVAQHATPVEQAAPPSTPLDDETVKASQGITSAFNSYLAAGNDIGQLSKDEIDAVITGAAMLPPVEHPETDAARMLALYKKGKTTTQPSALGLAGTVAKSFLDTAWNLGTQAADAVEHFTGQSLLTKGLGDWLDYGTKQGTASAMALRYNFGGGGGVAALWNGAGDLIKSAVLKNEQDAETDPDHGAQLDVKQSEIIRQRMLREAQAQQNMTQVRDGIASVYKQLGADHAAATVMSVDPSSPLVQAEQVVTDPTTWLMGGAETLAGKVFGGAMKAGVRMQRFTEAGIRVGQIEDQLASTALARTNLEAVLQSPAPLTDTARAGIQSNLGRIRTVQGNLSATYDAAKAEQSTALVGANAELTKMAAASPVRGAMGKAMQTAGGTATKILDAFSGIPEAVADRFVPLGSDAEKAAFANMVRRVATGGAAAVAGHPGAAFAALTGADVGIQAGIAGKSIDLLTRAARNLSTVGEQMALGQQTLPYLRAVADKTTGLTSVMASKLDKGLLAPLIYAAPKMAAGGLTGGAIGAGLGYIQSGGDINAAAQGFGSGALFGSAGSGLGQIGKFNSPAELRQAAIGDRSRFIKALSPDDLKLFNQLHPENQLAVGVYGMAHPDLDIHFMADKNASNGSWTPANPRGSVMINVQGTNPVEAILSHEIGHHVAEHGLGNQVDAYIRGNVVAGQPGITTALDAAGKPMIEKDPVTGKTQFVQNDMFQRAKADYNGRKLRDNPHATPEDDYGIAQEIFADLHASYLSDPATLQKMIRGHIPSDIVSENAVNGFFRKTGMGNDANTGNPVATGDLSNVKGLRDILNNYYKQRQYKTSSIDTDRGATKVAVGDVIKGTPEFDRLVKNLDATGDLVRNADGSIKTDLSGPIAKTKSQADADHAALAKAVIDHYRAQPGLSGPDNQNGLKLVTDRNGRQVYRGQVVPDQVFDAIAATNQHNSNQILNWRKLNGIMARDDGTMTNGVYNTATKGKGRYATVEARERALVPLYTEVSPHTNQVNVQMYDPETMQANLTKVLRGKQGKTLWGDNVGAAVTDVRAYLDNLANNRPGEAGIGLQKKGVINEMFGINADANPYVTDVMKRSPSVFKTFRIDRMNRINELPANEPVTSQTYEQVRSFQQPRMEPRGGAIRNPSDKAFTSATDVHRTERTPEQHDIVAARIMHEWNTQKDTVPLVARRGEDGHVVTDKDGNIQYKTQDLGLLDAPVVKNLIKKYGKEEGFNRAKDLLSNRLAEQYKKWEGDPDLKPAIGWYSGMRDRLQSSFGATIDKFANMLAATSPQEGVKTNFNYTIEALRKMSKGDYDTLMTDFREFAQQATDRIMGDDSIKNKEEVLRKEINKFGSPKGGDIGSVPLKENGKKYGINSQRVLHALTDYWVDQAAGPKTSNFGENLSWRSIDPTIDVWAGRTARRLLYEGDVQRWRVHPQAEGGAGARTKSGHDDYTLAESGYRGAAGQVGMNPDDAQAFLWFGEKKHYIDRGWTGGAGATLGDFRNVMDQMDFQRYQAGLTTNRGETAEVGAPKLEAARRDMEKSIQGLGNGVVAQRVTTSQGRYGDYNEPTLDTEFTTKQGQDISSVEDKIKQIAKAHDQDAAFLSRIHDDPNAPGARPIVEMGFNKPATDEEIGQWVGAFKKYGLGGFTVARDSRGKALGIRSQSIPEFTEGAKPEEYEGLHREFKIKLNQLRNDPSLPHRNITYDKDRYADTKIFRKGEHY